MKRVEVVVYSRADESAYASLGDAMEITEGLNVRVIGGHMVALLKAVFPVEGSVARYTRDSDLAVDTEIAASGRLHDALVAKGYVATAGNHYESLSQYGDPRQIDVLVPSPASRFVPQQLGGRAFDSAPGIRLALAQPSIDVRVIATMTDKHKRSISARLPTVEAAVILKSISYEQRRKPSDLEDLIGLLEIAAHYPPHEIGGWGLNSSGTTATRAQAASFLLQFAHNVRSLPDVPGKHRLTALVAELVSRD